MKLLELIKENDLHGGDVVRCTCANKGSEFTEGKLYMLRSSDYGRDELSPPKYLYIVRDDESCDRVCYSARFKLKHKVGEIKGTICRDNHNNKVDSYLGLQDVIKSGMLVVGDIVTCVDSMYIGGGYTIGKDYTICMAHDYQMIDYLCIEDDFGGIFYTGGTAAFLVKGAEAIEILTTNKDK